MILVPHHAYVAVIDARTAAANALRRIDALTARHPPRSWRRTHAALVALREAVDARERAHERDVRWSRAMHRVRPSSRVWTAHVT